MRYKTIKYIFISIIMCALMFSSCKNKMKTPEGDFTIYGQIEGVDTLIFEKIEANSLILVDTLYAIDGEFVTANSIDNASFFLLRTPEGEGINLLIQKNDHIEIYGSRLNLAKNYNIKGSVGSQNIKELNNKLIEFEIQLNEIYEKAREAQKEDFIMIQERFNSIFDGHTNYLKTFIKDNIDSKISILALFQSVKGENILNLYKDYDTYKMVADSFTSKWPNSSHTTLINQITSLAFAKDFTLSDTNNKAVSFSEFKGKLVLLDFWASWCKPCRAANPKIVELYNKFHHKGLEIIGISLDGTPQQSNPKQDWLDAISEDGLAWTQLSDLKGWETSIRSTYAFKSIPFTILIAPDGRVLGENIEQPILEETIAKYLND